MTTGTHPDHDAAGLFIADIHPRLGEYLAKRHAAGYDATAARARFLAWLTEHAEGGETLVARGAQAIPDIPADGSAHALEAYLRQASQVPELSAGQEAALAVRIAAGRNARDTLATADGLSDDARADLERVAADGGRANTELLEANLQLVVAAAKRFSDSGVTFLDLVQAGIAGLTRAIEKFDHTKGYRFSTYATWWIRRAITRALADHGL